MLLVAFLAFSSLLSISWAACSQPTVTCQAGHSGETYAYGCQVTNYRGMFEEETQCKVAKAAFPRTETELLAVVADGVMSHSKMKVTTSGSHSLTRLACPSGNANNTLVISTIHYNSRISVNHEAMTVTVDSGVKVRALLDTLASHGLAMIQSTDWDGISVGGMVSTGAHGSGLWGKGGGVHDHVVGMSLVIPASSQEGYSKLVTLGLHDPDLKAARLSLGVLGVISQITFSVEKMFKRSVTVDLKDDHDLQTVIVDFAHKHEFGFLNWYPSMKKVVFVVQDRVNVTVPGNGSWKNPAFAPQTVQQVQQTRAKDEQIYMSGNLSGVCSTTASKVIQSVVSGNGYLNDGKSFNKYPVIGYNHLIQTSSGCQESNVHDPSCTWKAKDLRASDLICNWDTQVKGMFFFHTAIGISLSFLPNVINDIKKLRNMYFTHICGLDSTLGFVVRFFKKSQDYLGQQHDTAQIEFFSFRFHQTGEPRVNEHLTEEIEQIFLFKYGGIPHFGKNRVVSFKGVYEKLVDVNSFLNCKKKFDKDGLFSSDWSDRILGIGTQVEVFKKECAVDGLCICKEDKHCAPHKGYFCSPGTLWNKARVCKHVSS